LGFDWGWPFDSLGLLARTGGRIPAHFRVDAVKEMNMDRHKCARPDCREAFTGEKPEGWMSLEPMLPTHGTILFYCAYQRMLMGRSQRETLKRSEPDPRVAKRRAPLLRWSPSPPGG